MDERQKKSFELLTDTTKQLITLTTLFFGFSVTFLTDLDKSKLAIGWVIASWILHILSICSGILTLLALTGQLGSKTIKLDELDIYRANVRLFSFFQLLFFIAGLVLTLIYAIKVT